MTLKERMDWTEKKIDESCKQGEDTMTIRYWVGYLDGLIAALTDENEREKNPLTCDGCRLGELAKEYPLDLVECYKCSRQNGRTDHYQPKGEKA